MFLLKKLLSAWLLPPVGMLVIALSALLIGKRGRGNAVAIISILLTLLFSLPFVSEHLASLLEGMPVSTSALREAQAIVVLGGGTRRGAVEYGGDTVSRYSLERVRYGAKLARESGLPILVTGGSVYGGRPEAELMQQVLRDEFSLPVSWVESESRDTNENALLSTVLLRNAGIQRVALVTHAWHMSRAIKAFEQQGFKVIPAATGFSSQGANLFERLLPSAAALEQSAIAIHEWAGLLLIR